MIIRICTEDKNYDQVRVLCSARFDGFTIYRAAGVWKGVPELALVIEIAVIENADFISNEREQYLAKKLAEDIKKLNAQESVLIEYIESTNVLI